MFDWIVALGAGALGWTLLEYLLHRFAFHGGSVRRPGAREHRRHHAEGDYFAPWKYKAVAALVAVALILPLTGLVAGWRLAIPLTLGFVVAYLGYEVLHRRAHTHAPRNRYGRWRRKHHFAHHFMAPRRAQGVTTPLWDWVFGTRFPTERVRVPRRLAMPWLLDERGEVRREYQSDYKLVGTVRRGTDERRSDRAAALANESPPA